MKTTKSPKTPQSSTCQNTLTSATTRSSTTSSLTSFSKHSITSLTRGKLAHQNSCPISFSCALARSNLLSSVIFSHRLLRTSEEDHLREDRGSCSKRKPTLDLWVTNRRTEELVQPPLINIQVMLTPMLTTRTVKTKKTSKTSWKTKSQRTLRVRKKT